MSSSAFSSTTANRPAGVGKHVDHGAGGGECRKLRIQARSIEPVIDHADIDHHQRLQPALRMQPPQWVLARSVGMANLTHTVYEFCEYRQVTIFHNPFLGAHAEHNLLPAAKGFRLPAQPRAGEFQAAPAKSDLRRGERGHIAIGQQDSHSRDRLGKSPPRCAFVGGMHQASHHVPSIGAVDSHQRVVPLVEFVQLPRVPLRRPQMKQAFVVFTRNRILGPRQIKSGCSVFQRTGPMASLRNPELCELGSLASQPGLSPPRDLGVCDE
jgi:hypothetical protein